jgi:hypothetical protein
LIPSPPPVHEAKPPDISGHPFTPDSAAAPRNTSVSLLHFGAGVSTKNDGGSMATENDDDRDVGEQDGCLYMQKCILGRLMSLTGEQIGFEDHDDYVVVDAEEFYQLRALAAEISREVERLSCEEED